MNEYNPFNEVIDPVSVRDRLLVTKDTIQDLKDTKYIIDGMFAEAHVHVIIAKPNTGKTALLTHLCPFIAKKYDIDYFNFDGNAADVKRQFEQSEHIGGYNIMNAALGRVTMKEVMSLLDHYSVQKNMHLRVLVLDTLKQFTNVINKAEIKPFMQLLSRIAMTGCAVIVLGHANKALDANGDLVFEGTNDLESETDELSYMYYAKDENKGHQIISFIPQKTRGEFERKSWKMDLNTRDLTEIEYVDIKEDRHEIKEKITAGKTRANMLYQIVVANCKTPGVWHDKLALCGEVFCSRVEGLDNKASALRAFRRALKQHDKIEYKEGKVRFIV